MLASNTIVPRWNQLEAVGSIFQYYYDGNTGHPLIVCPTGAGKSHILGLFCKQVIEAWPDQRIVVVSHVKEIVKQDADAVKKHLPEHLVGIYSAGLGIKQKRSVTVASIQSIYKKGELFKDTSLILVDEAHRIPPGTEGMYHTFFDSLPHAKIPGLTATPFRLKQGYLHKGDDALFTDIIYDVPMLRLINEGYLSNLISKAPKEKMDIDGVRTRAGDFKVDDLVKKLDRQELTRRIVAELSGYKDHYKTWLVFAIDIGHCEHIAAELSMQGITAAAVHSKMPAKEYDTILAMYKRGMFQALVSVETLTTGFDHPAIDLIALLRPTKSPVLHVQMVGRGLRVVYANGMPIDTAEQRIAAIEQGPKPHCLVLDFAGNTLRLGPINDVHVKEPGEKKGPGTPIVKECPECSTICYGSLRFCPTCNYEFEFKEKLKTKAIEAPIIRKEKKPKKKKPEPTMNWHDVSSAVYTVHTSKAGRKSMKVTYQCGLRTFNEYISIGAVTRAGYHAAHWWNYRSTLLAASAPDTVEDAVTRAHTGELRVPRRILVYEAAKYPSIERSEFD